MGSRPGRWNNTYKNMEWSQRRYEEFRVWLDGLKCGLGCADCGFTGHPAALEFDHRPGTEKRFIVSSGYSRNRAKVLAEIEKCDLVCANCHRIRTHDRRVAA